MGEVCRQSKLPSRPSLAQNSTIKPVLVTAAKAREERDSQSQPKPGAAAAAGVSAAWQKQDSIRAGEYEDEGAVSGRACGLQV